MSVFESAVTVNKPAAQVYAFLADMNNHHRLMPDNIADWVSTTDEASFTIPNITSLSLTIAERVTDSLIRIIPAGPPPFEMELKWELTEADNTTEAVFTITAGLNMMMKMLASGPLQKLADEETTNLAKLLS
ncbi:SRPBCC family protein [Mucilaginibacter sp. AK015]|uniref:SRPBCC family protein n=1 Tax=Mucilaginibacter sp. AK015 TaxID=2723072 RepID=UPI00160E6236|nr:SRPBCC family protein [Mucilaginibacter sp. AK015]MBB5394628.1 carbon monoxide dehydrogenase subunit G [Mucilaginibacter sp. AK015]